MLAAKMCEKLVNIFCINGYSDNEIIAKVENTYNNKIYILCVFVY